MPPKPQANIEFIYKTTSLIAIDSKLGFLFMQDTPTQYSYHLSLNHLLLSQVPFLHFSFLVIFLHKFLMWQEMEKVTGKSLSWFWTISHKQTT